MEKDYACQKTNFYTILEDSKFLTMLTWFGLANSWKSLNFAFRNSSAVSITFQEGTAE